MESERKGVHTDAPRGRLRSGLAGLALLAVISLAAWLGPAAGDNPADANHNTVTVGIDTNTTGNAALALSGSFQTCRIIAVNDVIDVDLYVQNLSNIVSFDSYIKYDDTKLQIMRPGESGQYADSTSRFLLQQAQPTPPGNSFSSTAEQLPDTANPGEYFVGGYDTASTPGNQDPDPAGDSHMSGVLVRLQIKGLVAGFSSLTITPHGPSTALGMHIADTSLPAQHVGDGADSDIFVDNVINGGIVVGAGVCTDADADGWPDSNDNCPATSNPSQANFDGDANGDACDIDDDNDGLIDTSEPGAGCTSGGGQFDPDCDNDNRSDGTNDPDGGGPIVAGPDNCVTTANTNQLNTDGDALGDACDPDDDNDGVLDGSDNCPVNSNSGQSNLDGDPLGDACDLEDDGDGFEDTAEAWVGTNPADNCGNHTSSAPIYSQAWPGDVYSASGGIPATINKITIQDLASYLAPVRRFNTNPAIGGNPADPGYHIRWDIVPGPGFFSKHINIQDLSALITVTPLMFGGARAYAYPTACTP
jgi:hypothetical protein